MKSPATMRRWVRPHRVGDLGLERAVAVAQQHRHGVVERRWRRPGRVRPSPVKSPATIASGLVPHRDRLKRRGRRRQRGRQGVGSRAAGALDLKRIIPRREMLVDHVIRIAGRETIALDEHLALRVEHHESGREALGMDDRQQQSVRLHIDTVDRGRATAGLPLRRAGEIGLRRSRRPAMFRTRSRSRERRRPWWSDRQSYCSPRRASTWTAPLVIAEGDGPVISVPIALPRTGCPRCRPRDVDAVPWPR